jgi:hyperosmotically inducible periplasmic protein
MKMQLATAYLVIGALMTPLAGFAGNDADVDRSQPTTFVKDSVITTKVKSKLAAEHVSSLAKIQVDTDANGVVWLSGHANSQADIDKAVSIARGTEGVVTVKNHLKVKADD